MAKKNQPQGKQTQRTEYFPLINQFLSGWKGFLILFVLGAIIMGIFLYPSAYQNRVPAGVDVVSDVGKTHQMMEFRDRTGQDPYWNPYVFGGMPYYHFIPPKAFSLDDAISLLHKVIDRNVLLFLLSGLTLYGLMLYLGIPALYAFLLSIAYFLWPHYYALLIVGHYMKFRALSYLPMVLFAFLYLKNKPSLFGGGLFALTFTLQMRTQHYQIVFYTLLLLFLISLVDFIHGIRGKEWQRLTRWVVLTLLSFFLVIVSIAQPTWIIREYARYSTRGGQAISLNDQPAQKADQKGVGIDYATRWSLAPSELVDLYVARFHGGTSGELYDGKSVPQWRGQKLPLYWGEMPFTQSYEYMGILLIILAFAGLISSLKQDRLVQGLGFTLLIALLLGFGRHFGSFYKLFFYYVPYFDKFRVPHMIITLIYPILLLLAGFGVKFIHQQSGDEEGRKKILLIIGFGAILFIAAFLLKIQSSFLTTAEMGQYQQQILNALQDVRSEISNRGLFSTLIFLLLGTFLMILIHRRKMAVPAAIAGILIIHVLDVWPMTARYINQHNQFFPVQQLKQQVLMKTELENTLLNDTDFYRVYPFGPFFQDNSWSTYFASIGGYDAAKMQTIQNIIDNNLMQPVDGSTPINWNIMDILNVKYIFLPQQISLPQLELVVHDQAKNVYAYLYKNWQPRMFPVGKVEVLSDEKEILRTLNSPRFRADSVALITSPLEYEIAKPDSFAFTMDEYNPNTIRATLYSSSTTFLVISEMWYPRWKAYLDDQPVFLYRVNHAIRGIVLPAGKHTLVMQFDDSIFQRAVMISWAGLLIIYALTVAGWMQIRRNNA